MASLPGLSEWIRVLDHRLGQIDRMDNIQLGLGRHMELEDILDYGGEIVIAATGSAGSGEGLNWATHRPTAGADADLDHVVTPEQLVASKPIGDRVVLYDCDGYFLAPSLAEKLAQDGHHITILTPYGGLAPTMEHTFEARGVHQRLEQLGVKVETEAVIDQITPGSVEASRAVYRDHSRTFPADSVVLVTQRVSNDEWFRLCGPPDRSASEADLGSEAPVLRRQGVAMYARSKPRRKSSRPPGGAHAVLPVCGAPQKVSAPL